MIPLYHFPLQHLENSFVYSSFTDSLILQLSQHTCIEWKCVLVDRLFEVFKSSLLILFTIAQYASERKCRAQKHFNVFAAIINSFTEWMPLLDRWFFAWIDGDMIEVNMKEGAVNTDNHAESVCIFITRYWTGTLPEWVSLFLRKQIEVGFVFFAYLFSLDD